MKKILFSFLAVTASLVAGAVVPHRVKMPEVPGYVLLKGDCHVHTVFSDATVWPTTRVDEAAYDGLDFISITDHCDTRHQKMVINGTFNGENVDRNTSYKLAAAAAKKYGIMVVHGAELTRGLHLFPGHFNTFFIKDGNKVAEAAEAAAEAVKTKGGDVFAQEEAAIIAGLKEARAQGGFLQWNHPDWEKQAHNETVWWPIHTQVYEAGLMDGIEILNRFTAFDPEALQWAVEKNLNISAGTDCHGPMFQMIDYEKGEYRPMTVAFAKERSLDGLREAMDAHRCCVFGDGCLYGPAELLEAFFKAAFEIRDLKVTSKKISFTIVNNTSIPFVLTKAPGSEDVVYPRLSIVNEGDEIGWKVNMPDASKPFDKPEVTVNLYVQNFLSNVGEPLKVSYTFPVGK